MNENPSTSPAIDEQNALCDRAMRLVRILPHRLRAGDAAQHLLDQMACLMQELKKMCESGTLLPQRRQEVLAKVVDGIREAQLAAEEWISVASPKLDRIVRSWAMQRAYNLHRS
jgi:hypothetical protein